MSKTMKHFMSIAPTLAPALTVGAVASPRRFFFRRLDTLDNLKNTRDKRMRTATSSRGCRL
jgi:hypothetical protein